MIINQWVLFICLWPLAEVMSDYRIAFCPVTEQEGSCLEASKILDTISSNTNFGLKIDILAEDNCTKTGQNELKVLLSCDEADAIFLGAMATQVLIS